MHPFKTYAVSSPIQTHTRPATCAEVECEAWKNGWVTRVNITNPLGKRQADYIAAGGGGRECHEITGFGDLNAGRREFMFNPGQRCFREHRVPLEREPIFVVRDGSVRRVHANGDNWVDDFRSHMDKINKQIGR